MNKPIDPIPSREHLRSVEAAIEYQQAPVKKHSGDDEFLAVAERVLLGLTATAEMMRIVATGENDTTR